MSVKYYGSIETLKDSVASSKIPGEWQSDGSKQTFRSCSGGILNWWPSSGTVQFQGKEPGKSQLQHALHNYLADMADISCAEQPTGTSIHHVAASNADSCFEPSVMRSCDHDDTIAFKADLAPLLIDLADVFAKQQLVLVVVDGVPRIVQEHACEHCAISTTEDKPPMHIRHC